MTVGALGTGNGILASVDHEESRGDELPFVALTPAQGCIQADLTIGADVLGAAALRANEGLTSNGVMLGGRGFLVESGGGTPFARS